MKCQKCKNEITSFEQRFYGTCGYCYIEEKHEIPGRWTRKTNVERNLFAKDLLQPLKKDGTINKNFIQAHGTKTLEKEWKMSKKEIESNL